MKRIEFIAPVEALRGNLSGSQTLVYAENDNPAYEAPDGRQYARNYKPRYIGFRRSKDGAVYFGVKRKSATKVDAASRLTMSAMGSLQTLKNTLKEKTIQVAGVSGKVWSFMFTAYKVLIEKGDIPADLSFVKWSDQQLLDMLRYKQDTISFKPFPAPSQASFSITNPYTGNDITAAEVISNAIFAKFNPVLTLFVDFVLITVNGKQIVAPGSTDWMSFKGDSQGGNPNYDTLLAPLAAPAENAQVLWNGQVLYDSNGVVQMGATTIREGEKYTTIAPTA